MLMTGAINKVTEYRWDTFSSSDEMMFAQTFHIYSIACQGYDTHGNITKRRPYHEKYLTG